MAQKTIFFDDPISLRVRKWFNKLYDGGKINSEINNEKEYLSTDTPFYSYFFQSLDTVLYILVTNAGTCYLGLFVTVHQWCMLNSLSEVSN